MSSNKNNLLSYRHRQRVRFWLWLVVVWACCSFVFIHQHSNSLVKENNSWEDYNYDGLATVVASWPDIIRSVASDQASDADLASDATASLSTTNTSSFTTTTTSDQAPSAQASSDQSPSARASSEPEHHALVVPYRDRPKHLQVFLDHMGPWFESHYPDKQFSIWIVEQDDNDLFNRAWLGNVGITEIIKHQPNTHCIIFHDVDLIPNASTTNMVPYPKCDLPIQLGSELEHFNWTVPYPTSFGGITSMSQKHWKQINGLSNDYVGWGGEDDDLYKRIRINNLVLPTGRPNRPPKGNGIFNTISENKEDHARDSKQKPIGSKSKMLARLKKMNENSERWKHDGLNDVYYTTTGTETHKHVDTKTHQSTTISQVHHIKVIPRKDSGKVDDQGKPVPKLEFIHIPYNGGQAVTTAAARKGVVWGACHYGSFQEWECPEKGSGDWRFGYNPYRATYRQGQRPWLLPPKDFENHPYQGADQFVVARNPYERAISFYRQVYDEEHGYPHGFEKHHQPSQQSLYLKRREDPERMNRFLTSHFVNVARDRIPLRETDLPPQVMFVDLLDEKTKKVSQQYTIKYENLQDNSFRDLMKRYHLADDPLELPPPARQEGAIYLSSEDLVGSTLVLLNILYRRDFRAFNYTLINPRMEFEIALELAVNVTAAEDASDAENFVKPNLNALEYIPIPYTVERDMTIAGSNAGDVWGACHWGQFDWYNCPFGSGHLMLRENRYIRYKADNYPQAMEPWHVPLYQFRDAPLESSTLRFTVVMNPYRRAIEFYRRVYDQRHGYPHGFPMENSRIAKREGDELPKSDEIYLEKRERADSLNEFLQKILMPFHTPLLPNGMEMLPQFHYIFQQTSERTFLYVNEALHWENLEKEWTTRVIEKENISMTIELPAPPSLGVSSGVPNVHLLSIKDLTNKTIAMLNDHYKVDFQYLGYKMKQTNIDISSFWHPVLPSKEVRAYAKGPNSMAVIAATRPSNNAPTKGEIKKQTTVLPLTSKETDAIAVPYGLLPEEDASTVGSRGVEDRKKILQQEQDALPIDANEQANGSRGDIEDLRNALLQNRKNAGVPSNAGNRKRRHSNYKKALRLRQARARTRLTKKH